jgi:hypothetical protein
MRPSLPRRWLHLVRRFFGFLTARSLSPREQSEARALLTPPEALLFFRQRPQDQRHALDVARRVLEARPGDRTAANAALLHDVGKIDGSPGAVGRSLATVLAGLGVPLRGSYLRYREHAGRGAALLETAGAGPLAVAFARHHPGGPPDGVDASQWRALLGADHG